MPKPPSNSSKGSGNRGGTPSSNSGARNGGTSGSNGLRNSGRTPGSNSGAQNKGRTPGSNSGAQNKGGTPGNRSSQQLQKASLISKTDPVNPIEFMFNPTDLQFSRTVDIQTQCGAITSKGLPKVVFGHVAPYELSLSGIVFDTFEQGTSVINEIQPLLDAVDFTKFNGAAGGASNSTSGRSNPRAGGASNATGGRSNPRAGGASNATGGRSNPRAGGRGNATGGRGNSQADSQKRQRPPVYYFMWGEQNYVQCMVKSLTCKLTMFLSDGTPVRAIVDLSLQQVDLGTVSTILS